MLLCNERDRCVVGLKHAVLKENGANELSFYLAGE
jgi:hypothetical protein